MKCPQIRSYIKVYNNKRLKSHKFLLARETFSYALIIPTNFKLIEPKLDLIKTRNHVLTVA